MRHQFQRYGKPRPSLAAKRFAAKYNGPQERWKGEDLLKRALSGGTRPAEAKEGDGHE